MAQRDSPGAPPAVCGVTDEPPTLLVCLNRGSRHNVAFRTNGKLCANLLNAEQQTLAGHFANSALPVAERFAAAQWEQLVTGAPALRDALASLECEIEATAEVGTHTVFFCAVKAAHTQVAGDALIDDGRRYHRVGDFSAYATRAADEVEAAAMAEPARRLARQATLVVAVQLCRHGYPSLLKRDLHKVSCNAADGSQDTGPLPLSPRILHHPIKYVTSRKQLADVPQYSHIPDASESPIIPVNDGGSREVFRTGASRKNSATPPTR